jgi:hypothetical protein
MTNYPSLHPGVQAHLVHIGVPKTASTWLQRSVFPALGGIAYGNVDPSVRSLVDNLLDRHGEQFVPTALRAVVENYDAHGSRILISDEGLSGDLWPPWDTAERYATRIASAMPDADVLIFTRNQTEMLTSVYAQYVAEGGTCSFERFLSGDHAGPAFDPSALDYGRLVDLYRDLFPSDHVWVVPFERLRNDPASFLRDLCTRYQVELGPVQYRRMNASPSPAGLAVLRGWNSLFRASQFSPDPTLAALPGGRLVRKIVQETVDPVLRPLVPTALESKTNRVARAAARRYENGNVKLAGLIGYPLRELGYPWPRAA